MKKISYLALTLIFINIVFIGIFLFRYCSGTAPMIGHDYRYFIPNLIDNYLFQKVNGLAIHWYTPSFAGGESVYPNPQDISYSLPQLLTWFVNPWQALRLSIVIYVAIGFIATYYFLNHLLEFSPLASILGAVFFSTSGFYIQHMAVGHVTFETFPLFGIILIILYTQKISHWLGGLLLSLLAALLIYAGSFEIIFLFILSILLSLPIIYLIKPSLFDYKRLLFTALWGLGLSTLTCGSKFYAIYSLMKFSPRLANEQYNVNGLTGLIGMVYQLLGSMIIIPLRAWIERSTVWLVAPEFYDQLRRFVGTWYGIWELDISLSPPLLLLLVGGGTSCLFHLRKMERPFNRKRLIAAICLVMVIWLVVEFTLAKGVLYPILHSLPVLSSLSVTVRYPAAFIFPLAMVGAAIFNKWTGNWKSSTPVWIVFCLLNGLALYSINIYNQVPSIDLQQRIFDIRGVLPMFSEMRKAGESFPIRKIIPNAHAWQVFQNNATNLTNPYDPLFWGYSKQFRQTLHAGSVFDTDNGYFNMINPTGYVYPNANGTRPFERIRVSDKVNFQNFINRRQTDWKLPTAQYVLDWITAITLSGEFIALLISAAVLLHARFSHRV